MSKETLDSTQIRQGDVLLVRTGAEPQRVKTDGKRLVLKEGEATGHAHAFYEPQRAAVVEHGKERHLHVVTTSLLRHEEHAHAPVHPGIYDLPTQVEWTDEDEPRAVED